MLNITKFHAYTILTPRSMDNYGETSEKILFFILDICKVTMSIGDIAE